VFDSRQELGIFLFATASRPALGPIQPPIQWVPAVLSPGVKRLRHDANHSPPSSAEIKYAWSCTSTLTLNLHGAMINETKDMSHGVVLS